MSDNKKIKQPQDSSKINVNEDYELNYWSKTLRVSKSELKQAVRSAGTGVDKVKEYLGIR